MQILNGPATVTVTKRRATEVSSGRRASRMNGSQETGLRELKDNLCAGGGCRTRLESCVLFSSFVSQDARKRSFFMPAVF